MALVKLNNRAVKDIDSLSVGTGDLVFISKQTASSDASISFTSGIDSTYKEYVFFFNNIHIQTNEAEFQFNMSTDGGSNYNVTKTSTSFRAIHREADTAALLQYYTSSDLAQSTGFQPLGWDMSSNNDSSLSGYLQIFNPSSTTFVKHFIASVNFMHVDPRSDNYNYGGYGNTTSAVDAIQFKMSSGNIDSGDILLYGVN